MHISTANILFFAWPYMHTNTHYFAVFSPARYLRVSLLHRQNRSNRS